jgi:hypothetical protein
MIDYLGWVFSTVAVIAYLLIMLKAITPKKPKEVEKVKEVAPKVEESPTNKKLIDDGDGLRKFFVKDGLPYLIRRETFYYGKGVAQYNVYHANWTGYTTSSSGFEISIPELNRYTPSTPFSNSSNFDKDTVEVIDNDNKIIEKVSVKIKSKYRKSYSFEFSVTSDTKIVNNKVLPDFKEYYELIESNFLSKSRLGAPFFLAKLQEEKNVILNENDVSEISFDVQERPAKISQVTVTYKR